MNMDTVRKALKVKRLRPLKNLLWVLLGVLLGVLFAFGAVYYVLKAVPLNKVITNNDVVSENITNESILNNVKNFNNYKISDLPVLEKTLNEILGGDLAAYVTFDSQRFSTYNLMEIGTAFSECVTVDLDNIKLTKFIPNNSNNARIYTLICDATGVTDPEQVTVNDFASFNADNIKLTSVIDQTTNAKVFDMLREATEKSSNEEITLADFTTGNFKEGKIKFCDVFPYAGNEETYTMICDALGKTENTQAVAESIRVEDLGEFDSDKIKLVNILPKTTNNTTLYNILIDVIEPIDGDISKILVGNLTNFDTGKIKLNTVVPKTTQNEKLYAILSDITDGLAYDQITVSSITSFEVSKIKISSILDPNSDDVKNNAILKKLVEDTEVTVANIGTKTNQMKLSDIYPDKCFIQIDATDISSVRDTSVKYQLVDGVYTKVDATSTGSDVYYISSNANIWFFMLYNGSDAVDADGYALSYTATNMTYGELGDSLGGVTSRIDNATIRQLWLMGLIADDDYTGLWTQTLNDALHNQAG